MKAFAELLDRLVYTPQRNAKLQLMARYFAATPDPAVGERASTLISADPVAMLQVFYRRQSQWSAIAKGQMVSYGTRPMRALTLKDKFLPI